MRVTNNPSNLRRNRKAASPAVSLVIITAATIVLVLVSGNYALQVLTRQQATSEFDTIQKSIITLDDAIRDIAWDRGGSRAVRFTIQHGGLSLIPDKKPLSITVEGYPSVTYSTSTGVVRYSTASELVSFGNGYSSYLLGNKTVVVSKTTESFGQVLVEQQSGFLNLTLGYRIRVAREGPSTSVGSESVNYVDIFVVRLVMPNQENLLGDLDLIARNVGITTTSSEAFTISSPTTVRVSVNLDGVTDGVEINLGSGLVVFNFIVADVKVST